MKTSKSVLPIIVISQFCCTSLWFAGNGVMGDLILHFGLAQNALGHVTSAVQFGFILGTLTFAIFTIADRFSPSNVFFTCALLGALFNLAIMWEGNGIGSILSLRFLTGFFLAGIYPVGMKIAADHFEKGLNKSLGYLVGALALGTAFPHLAKDMTAAFPWKAVLILTSSLATAGGLIMWLGVPNGPFRKPSKALNVSAFFGVFKRREFRAAAFGYFGHMWELYAFWAFVPILLWTAMDGSMEWEARIPFLSFMVIGIGGLGCIIGGYAAHVMGTKRVAFMALLLSGICCLISPWMLSVDSVAWFLVYLFFWGFFVIMDSPLFSTLVADNADAEVKGTAITIVNCIGFAITIVSIQLLSYLQEFMNPSYMYVVLAVGPVLGLLALREKNQTISI